MKQHHKIKILPIYYEYVRSGRKTFEVRKNDRNYLNADIVTLQEWDQEYTGRSATFEIGYVLNLGDFMGDKNEYVVFSLIESYYMGDNV